MPAQRSQPAFFSFPSSSGSLNSFSFPSPGLGTDAFWVILLGLMIRLYAFYYIPLINPDGTLYIQQAKAFYYGLRHSLTDCYHYVSVYPILIAAVYSLLDDWILGARIISLFFGTMALIPLYGLIRRFFDNTVSSLTLLVFALIPPFIYVSRDVMRDPVYWFFSLLGLYLFILHIEKPAPRFVFLSSVSLMMGMWARIEAVLYLLGCLCALIVMKRERRKLDIFFFLLFPAVILVSVVLYSAIADQTLPAVLEPRILTLFPDVLKSYQELRASLSRLIEYPPEGISPYFFPRVRNLIWLIALGTLCVQIIEALFYPFFLIFIFGVSGLKARVRKDGRLMFLFLLSVSGLGVLYIQTLFNWAMSSRFTVLFLFPGFFFIGFGLERIADLLTVRSFPTSSGLGTNEKQAKIYALICLFILLSGLPKTLMANYREDKLIFKEIGEAIAEREAYRREISVAGGFKRVRMIHFYANLNYKGAPCFDEEAILNRDNMANFQRIKEKRFNYFIWDEKSGTVPPPNTKKLREWRSSERGRLVLYLMNSE